MKIRRIACCLLCLVLFGSLAGCFKNKSSMPFNGDITFHQIKMTIPNEFVRDSSQSNDDVWLFEQGWYKKTIVVMRRLIQEDPTVFVSAYAQGLQNQGVFSENIVFSGVPAARSSATRENGTLWQELSFAVDGTFYAIALNGGTEAEFQALVDTIMIGS